MSEMFAREARKLSLTGKPPNELKRVVVIETVTPLREDEAKLASSWMRDHLRPEAVDAIQ